MTDNIKTFEDLKEEINKLLTTPETFGASWKDDYHEEVKGCDTNNNCIYSLNLKTGDAPDGENTFDYNIEYNDKEKIYTLYAIWGYEDCDSDGWETWCEKFIMIGNPIKDPQKIYNIIKAIKEAQDER